MSEIMGLIKFVAVVLLIIFILLAFGPELRPLVKHFIDRFMKVVSSI